jgi:hypothetical protein
MASVYVLSQTKQVAYFSLTTAVLRVTLSALSRTPPHPSVRSGSTESAPRPKYMEAAWSTR